VRVRGEKQKRASQFAPSSAGRVGLVNAASAGGGRTHLDRDGASEQVVQAKLVREVARSLGNFLVAFNRPVLVGEQYEDRPTQPCATACVRLELLESDAQLRGRHDEGIKTRARVYST
jgi:hypothetical protein